MGVDASGRDSGDVVFLIDARGEAQPMETIRLADAGLRERADLQRWIERYPEIVGRDLLPVTTEFNQWEVRDVPVFDRLDVLFLDSDGALLVAELKRDQAPDTIDLQALKYASYCAQLTVEDVIDAYARYHSVDLEAARAAVLEHAPSLEEGELRPIRVRLVAGGFGDSVTNVVLWLRDLGLDIGCIEVRALRQGDGPIVIKSRQLLPPPVAQDYLVKRRRREREEEEREARTRRRNAVQIILEHEAVAPGTALNLYLESLTQEWRPKVEEALRESPTLGQVEWTGLGLRKALRWRHDGGEYSCSGLVEKILADVGFPGANVPGPEYWVLPDGRTLGQLAIALEPSAGS